MEYKKRVVDSNIYAFMSGGTVSIKIVFPRGVYSTNSNQLCVCVIFSLWYFSETFRTLVQENEYQASQKAQ